MAAAFIFMVRLPPLIAAEGDLLRLEEGRCWGLRFAILGSSAISFLWCFWRREELFNCSKKFEKIQINAPESRKPAGRRRRDDDD